MTQRLSGKTAIVTGAGAGIGAATAILFAREGAAVVLADLDEAAAHEVREEIVLAGGRAEACGVDIRDAARIDDMLGVARREFGPVSILVNNAGKGAQQHFLDTPLETLRLMLDINLVGTFLCAQAAAREMAQTGGGRIVNVASDEASYVNGQTIPVDGGFTAAGLRVKQL